MINLLSISDFRSFVPISSLCDDYLVASSINQAQLDLVPSILSETTYFELINALEEGTTSEDQKALLRALSAPLAYYSAATLCTLNNTMIFPTQVQGNSATSDGKHINLKNHYLNQCSTALRYFYKWCNENNIEHNQFRSCAFAPFNMNGERTIRYNYRSNNSCNPWNL